jgi:hypothetical protein
MLERLVQLNNRDTLETPQNQAVHSVASISNNLQLNKPVGTCKLKDVHWQELNLDGTPKIPY